MGWPLHTLNLGILAHVDAGKTSLTERLLFEAGAIGELGSIDAGTTRTDSMDIERRRGITVRTSVASFAVGDVQVNLIDTPGVPVNNLLPWCWPACSASHRMLFSSALELLIPARG
jgi:small GTP-binding protein